MNDNGSHTAARRPGLVVVACAAVAGLFATAAIAAPAAPAAARRGPALDVYFLVDTSSSMAVTRDALSMAADQLVGRLRTRTTLRWGVAEFREPFLTTYLFHGPAYQQHAPVRASGGDLRRFRYGGGDGSHNGHAIGLDGVLGNAHEPWTMEPAPAGFAPHAKKLVVLVTDAQVRRGEPSITEVAARLRAAGVFVAALAVAGVGSPDSHFRTVGDLQEIAERTGTVARGPADCDGDGHRDFVRGGALVCPLIVDRPGDYRRFADALYARFWR